MEIKVPDTKASPHAALIAGLRELADFFEQHPELPEFRYPALQYQPIGTDDPDGVAAVEQYAAALGVEVTRRSHLTAKRQFAGLEFSAAKVFDAVSTEYRARQRMANAARWVFTCDDEPDAVSKGYETENAARYLLDAHREGCNGGAHAVKLIPAELVGGVR